MWSSPSIGLLCSQTTVVLYFSLSWFSSRDAVIHESPIVVNIYCSKTNYHNCSNLIYIYTVGQESKHSSVGSSTSGFLIGTHQGFTWAWSLIWDSNRGGNISSLRRSWAILGFLWSLRLRASAPCWFLVGGHLAMWARQGKFALDVLGSKNLWVNET